MPLNKILFHEVNVNSHLLKRRELKKYLLSIFLNEKKTVKRVDIILCSDEYLLKLNKDFLNHDYYTDTLSFLLSEVNHPIEGELYISVDRVSSNARKINIPYQQELVRVIIHSCLHLCGYLDHPKEAFAEMESLQELYVAQWIVSRETLIGG